MSDFRLSTGQLAAAITGAWLANPHTHARADEVPAFLVAVHAKLTALHTPPPVEVTSVRSERPEPAVSVRKSLTDPDFIVSMIDGQKYRTLTRHLSSRGMTPDQYRQRYGLPPSYPMTAPGYAAARSALSKRLGLGGRKKVTPVEPVPVAPPTRVAAKPNRARKSVAEAKTAARAQLEG